MAWRSVLSCCSYMRARVMMQDAARRSAKGGKHRHTQANAKGGKHEGRAAASAFDRIQGPRYDLEGEEGVREEQEDDVGGGA